LGEQEKGALEGGRQTGSRNCYYKRGVIFTTGNISSSKSIPRTPFGFEVTLSALEGRVYENRGVGLYLGTTAQALQDPSFQTRPVLERLN